MRMWTLQNGAYIGRNTNINVHIIEYMIELKKVMKCPYFLSFYLQGHKAHDDFFIGDAFQPDNQLICPTR